MTPKKKQKGQSARQYTINESSGSETDRNKIVKALNNGRFVARTISGIAKETSIERPLVVKILRTDRELRAQLKVLPRKTKDGRILITTKDHFKERGSFSDKFIDVFASRRVTLDDAS